MYEEGMHSLDQMKLSKMFGHVVRFKSQVNITQERSNEIYNINQVQEIK